MSKLLNKDNLLIEISDVAKYYSIPKEIEKIIVDYSLSASLLINSITEIKNNSQRIDHFEKKLEFSHQTFKDLNKINPNRGNLLLAKRVKLLIEQLSKYRRGKYINSKLTMYFDKQTAYHLPSIGNVLSILNHNIGKEISDLIFNDVDKYYDEKTKSFDSKKLYNDIEERKTAFMDIQKLKQNPDLKYSSISINKIKIEYNYSDATKRTDRKNYILNKA
ncbi:MAG: hypothetical protein HRT41_12920 [Campylobacteraceae bacterium]|nr:hypothetical protein [Campylobacteraceae bacterium]